MTVLHLTDCPIGLRGALTKWLLEIASGVFVGQISSRVRDEIWLRVIEHCRNGRAVLVYNTSGEQRLDFRVHGETWEPIDFDGIKLMLRPSMSRLRAKRSKRFDGRSHGFSNASKQRTVKHFSNIRKRFPDNYAVVDLETTGLNPEKDAIIEIGAIKMVGHEKTDVFNALISTEEHVPPDVMTLTGINEQLLKEAGEPPGEVLKRFLLFVGDLPLVGHNIDFDKSFLQSSFKKYGYPPLINRCIDTLSLAKRLIKGVENHKLETLTARFGIEKNKSHRSVNDCEATGKIYIKLIELMDAE